MEIYIFDFDDTLFITKSKIYVRNMNNYKIIDTFTTNQYKNNRDLIDYYRMNNFIIDYSETDDFIPENFLNAQPYVKYIDLLKECYKNKCHIGIISARGMNPKYIRKFIYLQTKVKIPLSHIICVNNKNSYKKVLDCVSKNKKYFEISKYPKNNALIYFIFKKYNYIHYYDDDAYNINGMKKLLLFIKKKLYSTQIKLNLV